MAIGSTSSPKSRASTSHHRPTSSQACAACKYQRRKCNPDCILAPYFPANQTQQFLNAHRLFGVSKILKIIRHLDPLQRADAMHSIIFQSNARAHDPIGGCYGIIRDLESHLQRDSAELALVRRQLAIRRARAKAKAPPSPTTTALAVPDILPHPPDDDGGGGDTTHLVRPRPHHRYCDYFCNDGCGCGGSDHHDYGHPDDIIISTTDSPNKSKNYRDRGLIVLGLPVSPLLSLEQQQDAGLLVDMFDIRLDVSTGDDQDSSKNIAAAATSSKISQRKIQT